MAGYMPAYIYPIPANGSSIMLNGSSASFDALPRSVGSMSDLSAPYIKSWPRHER